MTILYLNNDGSRWVSKDRNRNKIQVKYPDGTYKARQVDFWESFGNFAVACVRIRGKRLRLLPSTTEPCKDGLEVYNLQESDIPPLKGKAEPETPMGCGHSPSDIVTADEGTGYCQGCEDAAREQADLDVTIAAEKFEEENL